MTYKTSRRQFLATASASGLILGLPGLRGARAQSALEFPQLAGDSEIVVVTWGGSTNDRFQQYYLNDFTPDYGISAQFTSYPDVARLEVMNQIGNVEWDMVDFEGAQMNIASGKGLLRPIDYDLIHSVVPADQLATAFCREYGIGSVSFSTNIGWNSNLYPDGGPQSWVEFFDTERFPGRRGLYAQPRPSFEIALMAAGVPIADIYPMDMNEAFEALDAIRDKVDQWVERTSQWGVMLQNNEVDLAGASLSRLVDEKLANRGWDLNFKQSILEQSYWTIPANAPNGDDAMKVLAWLLRAPGQKAYAESTPIGMTNTTIYDDLTGPYAPFSPASPANTADTLFIDDVWWTEHQEEAQVRWLDWLSAS
ncbi:MAG: extracellular solute-binding protein [Rhodobacter sp.]|nr:extracellular solute-binding protein [Paracoccaceae bacterium]MCC0077043.1 extracellular solute-binding protein [Rhodobacter sp.]